MATVNRVTASTELDGNRAAYDRRVGAPDCHRPRVTLVIVNYNSADLTASLVRDTTDGADEVIVVDNASPSGEPRDLASIRPNLVFVQAGANLGYGGAANLGASRATGEVLIVANPDISIGGADLRALAAEAMQPGVGVVAPRFVNPDGSLQRSAHARDPGVLTTVHELCRPFASLMTRIAPEWHSTLLPADAHQRSRDVGHVLGALVAVRLSTFRSVGGFDESFFLYREETDLCRRVRLAGWRNRHLATVTATHIGGVSTADESIVFSRPVVLESHYRFIEKHWGRWARRVAWAVGLVSSVLWVVAGAERRAGLRALTWHLRAGR